MIDTEFVAWWGAIVATFVLAWDVWKWSQNGAKIRTNITFNMHYEDGAKLNEEHHEDGSITSDLEEYCHIEFANIGDQPTTLMSLCGSTHDPKKSSIQIMDKAFTPHWGKKLPHILNPGDIWSCRIEMDRYYHLMAYGKPRFVARLSHLKKPFIFKATRAANKILKPELADRWAPRIHNH